MPFSATSLSESSDAGFLPLLGPVQMGQSTSMAVKKLQAEIDAWASNDRAGYEFGGMTRRKGQKFSRELAKRNVTTARGIADARMNGYSAEDAYKLVDTATRNIVGGLYKEILDVLPLEDPNADFDEERLGRLLRKANRLGRFQKDMYEALKDRLMVQNRWHQIPIAVRRRIRAIINESKRNPYGSLRTVGTGMDY